MANQQVKYTITGENLLSKVLKQVDTDAQKAEDSVKKVGKATSGAGGGGGGMLGSIVGGNLIANGISRISGSLVGFGKDVVDSLVNYQYFSTSLKTMMKGDADMSAALEAQLVSLAKTTPFSLLDVQQGTKQLMAYGFAGSEIVGTMKMLGDVSSGVGKPLNEVAYLYGTLKTQGRAFGKDINQFTSAGIPIVKQLAKQFGVTEEKVMDLVSAGKVGFKEIEQAFKGMTSEGSIFFNLMAEQSQTVGGKISAMGDTWEQIKVNIGKSQSGIIAGTVGFIDKYLSEMNKGLAAGNFSEEATGHSGRSFHSKYTIGGNIANLLTGNQGDANDALSKEMISLLENKTGNSKDIGETAGIIKNKIAMLNADRDYRTGDFGTDNISTEKYKDEMAILIKASKLLMGSKRLLNSKEEKIGGASEDVSVGGKGKGKSDKLGTGVTIEAQVPKNQYITINGGLVHEMKIESMDGSTPVGQIKEQISTTLVELLNDAYQAMR